MRRMLRFLFLFLCFPVSVFAGTGATDNRYYVTDEMWAQHPYNKFVHLIVSTADSVAGCSAQYVSNNLILSAAHCIKANATYTITNYKGGTTQVSLLTHGEYKNIADSMNDWAIWEINDPQFYGTDFFNIAVPTQTTPVINAGWGWMRVLTASEIQLLRGISQDILQEKKATAKNLAIDQVEPELSARAEAQGLRPLREDQPRLKASECYIVFEDCSTNSVEACQSKSVPRHAHYPLILASSCDSWGGNSGGGYISKNDGVLYGITSHGADSFYDNSDIDYLVSSRQFQPTVNNLLQKAKPETGVPPAQPDAPSAEQESTQIVAAPENPPEEITSVSATSTNNQSAETSEETVEVAATSPTDNTDNLEEELEQQQDKVSGLEDSLNAGLASAESMNDGDFLGFLDQMVEWQVEKERLEQLKKAYEAAKKKEQSFANRALTALSTAATGIGGMELLQGMAEQSADKDAAADMAAYIETMRCTYGEGKQVKAGTEEIELPGANDEQLMNLRAEYISLAADLKERKEALGMKPGIESEEILDRATSGLYDDESIGITNGNYASLYRAQMLSSEADQQKIDDAASKSKNRVIAGAVVGGVGVVGGILGNSLINGKLGEKLKQKKADKNDPNKEEVKALEPEAKAFEDLKKCLSDAGIKDKEDWGFKNFYPSILTIKNINCRNIKLKNNQKASNVKASEIFADSDDEDVVFDSMDKYFDMITISKMVGFSKEETVSNVKTKIKTSLANAKEKITKAQEKDASASSGGGLSDIAGSLLSNDTITSAASSLLGGGTGENDSGATNALSGLLGGN